jgi:hypothetical protein
VASAALTISLGACAGSRGPAPALGAHIAARNAYVIDGAALRASDLRTLAEVVSHRWPSLVYGDLPATYSSVAPGLNARVSDRFGIYDPTGAFLGGPDVLQTIGTAAVRRVVRLTAVDEFATFGRQHPAGALVVTWAWVPDAPARRPALGLSYRP